MGLRRLGVGLLLIVTVALFAALPAEGKDGVKATLETSVPPDATAGTRIDLAWTLTYVDEKGRERPFGAGGVFARLVSASGGDDVTEYASGDRGDYAATLVVPEGGIGDIEIGLAGWQSGKNGTRRADALFPITNDPVPGRRPPLSAPAVAHTGSPPWIFILVGGSLAAAFLTAALRRRWPLGRFG
jgi:hypothetical protein